MPARQDAHLDEFHRDQQWHKPVRVATTANVTIATALNSGDTIDGVTLADGDRVLVKDQSTGSQNGIYIAGATPARAYDMVYGIQAMGAFVYVRAGTTNGGTLWYNTNTTLPTIDTTALTWSNFAGGGGGGAPTTADYLVGTSQAGLSAEIVVGTTPGGELGGTWASPTVDSTHSGSAHSDFIAKSLLTTQDDIIVRDGTGPARLAKGSDGQVLTVDPTTHHLVWATPSGSGSVATDAIWDAKGDLAAGTGADTASKLTVGSDDTVLMADSAQSTGLKWVASQTPTTQSFSDVAAQGTADTYARGDHKHGMPADPGASGGSVEAYPFYGDGSDGNVTISVNTTITRDMYYNDLTVNTGVVLNPDQNRIFVKGVLTLSGTAKIKRDGNTGGNGGNGTAAVGGSAGSAATAISGNTIGGAGPGLAGKIGGFNANGTNGTNSTASGWGISHSTSAAGGDSGTGRTGGTGIGSTGDSTMVDKPAHWPEIIQIRDRSGSAVTFQTIVGIAPAAGSGAGSPSSGGGGSGGSGSSGGAVIVCARTVTGSGTLEAVGGTGGNGGNGGGTNAGGGAGGSGGPGGFVVLIYKDITGWSGSLIATGGSGGSGGSGIGSGTSGGTGTQGPTGKTFLMKLG